MRRSFALAVVALVALMAGCAGSRPVVTGEVVETPSRTPTPTPLPEELVNPSPVTEAVPSVEVAEELPQDLDELNRRGYLKDVFFDTDRYDLRPDARQILIQNAKWLLEHPNIKILIEGHCDERNTREYNLALGQKRADAVRDFLVALGVSPDRIRTISYGEERPFALGHNEAAWRLNRRAHFRIVGY